MLATRVNFFFHDRLATFPMCHFVNGEIIQWNNFSINYWKINKDCENSPHMCILWHPWHRGSLMPHAVHPADSQEVPKNLAVFLQYTVWVWFCASHCSSSFSSLLSSFCVVQRHYRQLREKEHLQLSELRVGSDHLRRLRRTSPRRRQLLGDALQVREWPQRWNWNCRPGVWVAGVSDESGSKHKKKKDCPYKLQVWDERGCVIELVGVNISWEKKI